MNTVIRLDNQDDRSLRQKAFRKQFAKNLNAALDRRGAIPLGYGRVTVSEAEVDEGRVEIIGHVVGRLLIGR